MIEKETKYKGASTAPVPYIIIKIELERVYRMEYDNTPPATITNDTDKIHVHDDAIKYKFGASGAGNNWAKRDYAEVVDVIGKEAESSDCPQGFQNTHSLEGGAGSGLGTLLLINITVNDPISITRSISCCGRTIQCNINIHQLLEHSDETFLTDNGALYNISHDILKQSKHVELNWVMQLIMIGITASLTLSGKLNGDLRKMGVNLVPSARLPFFTVALAPLFARVDVEHVTVTVQEITYQMWSSRNFLANVKSEDAYGKYLSACAYRCNAATQEVGDKIASVNKK